MNICIIATQTVNHKLGGREVHIKDLSEGLAKKGHNVCVLTTRHPEGIKYQKQNNVEIFYFKKSNPKLYRPGFYRDFIQFFEEINREKKFDVVHDQRTLLGHAFIKYRRNNIPCVLTMHGTDFDEIKSYKNVIFSRAGLKTKIKSFLCILKVCLAYGSFLFDISKINALIYTSHEQKEIFEKWYFTKQEKLHRAFNGVDTEKFSPGSSRIREKYGLDKKKIILSVSILRAQKGVQNIIRAMPEILRKEREAMLLVVGDGWYRPNLEKIVENLLLKEKVIFAGMVPFDQLPGYFRGCDIFVNSTIRQNGYDLTILEAMACQRPVVVSDIGSVPTLIQDKQNGILVKPGDVNMLAGEVVDLLKNKEKADKISKNGRETVIKAFSLDKMVEDTIKVYKKVILKT